MDWLASFNPGWFSFGVASLALVLSQIPPLRMLLKGQHVTLTVPSQFNLSHYLGQTNINIDLFIQNNGGTTVTVAKVNCIIFDNNDPNFFIQVPGQSYYAREGPKDPTQNWTEYTLGPISLQPGQIWAEKVHVYRTFSFDDEEKMLEVVSDIRADIRAKIPLKQSNDQNPVEANPNLVQKAMEYYRDHFRLRKGDYSLLVAVLDAANKLLTVERRDFLLFESHLKTLRQILDDYK